MIPPSSGLADRRGALCRHAADEGAQCRAVTSIAPEIAAMMKDESAAAEVRRYGTLLRSFVVKDIRGRYAGSLVGFFWTVVQPVLELLTYTFVFTVLLRVRFDDQSGTFTNALFLFCGLVPWFSHHEGLVRCTTVVRDHAHLIRKVRFPPTLLPVFVVLSEGFHQVIRTGLFILVVAVAGLGFTPHALLLVPTIILQLLFTLGLGMLLSTTQVFWKDVQHLLGPALMIWLFITPIFYPPDVFPKAFSPILMLNPLSHLVGIYRELLLNHRLPHWGSVIIFGSSAISTFLLGGFIFRRHARRFPDLV